MSDLSPELQKLVLAGRSATRPTTADFARVLGALQSRLGEVIAVEGNLAPSAVAGTTTALSGKVIGIALAGLTLVIGSIAYLSSRSAEVPSSSFPAGSSAEGITSTPIAAVSSAVVPSPETLTPAPAEVAPLQTQTKSGRPTSRARDSSRGRDSLYEEVGILSRAETELHSGRSENALKLLAEHERRFANGILAEERTAARIQALCALGRFAEANAQMARLKAGSLHGEQARQACAPAKSKPD